MYKFKIGQEVTLLASQKSPSPHPQAGQPGDRFIVTAKYDDGQYDIEPVEQEGEDRYCRFIVAGDQIYPDHLAEGRDYQPTYWNGIGKYQREYEDIFSRLVPERGQSSTFAGEALRITSRFYHDRFNNGDGNIYLPYFREMATSLVVCVKNFVLDVDPLVVRIASDIGIGHATCQELDQFVDWLLAAIVRSEQSPKTEEA